MDAYSILAEEPDPLNPDIPHTPIPPLSPRRKLYEEVRKLQSLQVEARRHMDCILELVRQLEKTDKAEQ